MAEEMAEKTVLITGGAGFIGSHLVEAFLGEGYRVHVIDDLSGGKRGNLAPRAELHELDIRSPGAPRTPRRPDGRAPIGGRPRL